MLRVSLAVVYFVHMLYGCRCSVKQWGCVCVCVCVGGGGLEVTRMLDRTDTIFTT